MQSPNEILDGGSGASRGAFIYGKGSLKPVAGALRFNSEDEDYTNRSINKGEISPQKASGLQ